MIHNNWQRLICRNRRRTEANLGGSKHKTTKKNFVHCAHFRFLNSFICFDECWKLRRKCESYWFCVFLNLSQSTCIRKINVQKNRKHSFEKQLINFTMSTDRNKPIMTLIHAQCTQPLPHEHKCSCQWHFTFSVTHHKSCLTN